MFVSRSERIVGNPEVIQKRAFEEIRCETTWMISSKPT